MRVQCLSIVLLDLVQLLLGIVSIYLCVELRIYRTALYKPLSAPGLAWLGIHLKCVGTGVAALMCK